MYFHINIIKSVVFQHLQYNTNCTIFTTPESSKNFRDKIKNMHTSMTLSFTTFYQGDNVSSTVVKTQLIN